MLSVNDESKLQQAQGQYDLLETNNKKFTGSYPPMNQGDKGFVPILDDFLWTTSDEPHTTRRRLILNKYPEINKLMGHCHKTKYSVLLLVTMQFGLAYYLMDKMWSVQYWVLSYCIGATITHSLFLAIHEISHFLAFKNPNMNRYLGFFANLPIGIPYSIAFRGYHMEHHSLQGTDGIDTDLPTQIEGVLFRTIPGKLFFCTFQILFYALRPMMVRLQTFTFWHAVNWSVQFATMGAMIYKFGPNPFFYFITSTVF
jgi:sphingolipid delta-4 desaturase